MTNMIKYDTRPIGIFDSGIGGLNFVKKISQIFPHENIIYYADNKNIPYGEKSKNDIILLSLNIITFLKEKNCKLILIACNTATCNALNEISNLVCNENIILTNVVEPVINYILKFNLNKIGIIGTVATVKSRMFTKKILSVNKDIYIKELATPCLVPIIEHNTFNNKKSQTIIENYLNNFKKNIDFLVLGCTHYFFIKNNIENIIKNTNIKILDSINIVSSHLYKILTNKNILNNMNNIPKFDFYMSKNDIRFINLCKKEFSKIYNKNFFSL